MSYPQFGYTYPSVTTPLSSTQLLMSGTATSIASTCCENGRPLVTDPHTGQTVCSCQYSSGLLTYPRVAGLTDSVYGTSAYATQGYVPLGTDTSAFYSSLNASYDIKDTTDAWRGIAQSGTCYPYDPSMTAYSYRGTYGGMDLNGAARRKNATRETTNTLKAWLYEHRKNPYPTKGEKIMLAIITKMTLTQVSTWFANARRRLKKENKMTWSPRNRCGDGEDGEGRDKTDSETEDGKDKEDELKKVADPTDLQDDDCSSRGKSLSSLHHDEKEVRSLLAGSVHSSPISSPLPPPPPASARRHAAEFSDASRPAVNDSPCASSSESVLSDDNSNLLKDMAHDHGDGLKPRIWSLADTATSSSGRSLNIPIRVNAKTTQPLITTGSDLRSWLGNTFNGPNSFSPVSAVYSLSSQRLGDSTPGVASNLSSAPPSSTSHLLRPFAQVNSFYSSARDLSQIRPSDLTQTGISSILS